MKEEKYKCPICHTSHNYSKDYSNISNYYDEKLLCSSCINKLLSKENNNNLVFPNDFIDNHNMQLINSFKNEKKCGEKIKHQSINESIIEEIKEQSNNKLLIEEIKQQFNNNKSIINGIKQRENNVSNTTTNNSKNSSKNKNKNYYVKKTVKVNKLSDKDINENLLCNIHLLPSNIICIDEKVKICRQCALSKNHLNNKIITEKDYYGYIDELGKIYNVIKINENKYSNINNDFCVIEEIDDLLLETEKNLTELKNNIINNINEQFIIILNYVDLRRKEIFEKYQYSKYDISNLNQSSQNWMNLVSEKLFEKDTKNNNYKIINYNFLENDENKNIFNMTNTGKQLNERYNFLNEIKIVIDKLKLYKDKGIDIKQNEDIVNIIINNDNQIISIQENKDLIKALNLSPYESLLKKSKTNKNNKTSNIFRKNTNDDTESDNKNIKCNTNDKNNNYYSSMKEDIECFESKSNKNQRVYFRKIISDMDRATYTENNFYKERDNRKIYDNQNNIYMNTTTGTGTKTNSKRNTVSLGPKNKNKNKDKEDINNIELNNESTFPSLNKISKINNNIKSLLRNKTSTNINTNNNKSKNKGKKNELIKINTLNDNKNININFNGHIFNYNSDSNFSINISDSNKKKNKIKSDNNNKINDFLQLLTPTKKEMRVKSRISAKNEENQKLFRCFSFNGESKAKKRIINNKINNSSNSTSLITNQNTNNIYNNIAYTNGNDNQDEEKSLRNFELFSKTNDIINKNSKKIKNNYKTLSNKELEKYVNYQLKKLKPNFNRINLKDNGMKIICAFFKKNKNKKYKEIKLQGCNINDFDFNSFTKSLIENNIIIPSINISENKLSDDCAFFIFDFFNEYGEIQNIIFSNNLFSKTMKEKIKEILMIKKTKMKLIYNFKIY